MEVNKEKRNQQQLKASELEVIEGLGKEIEEE